MASILLNGLSTASQWLTALEKSNLIVNTKLWLSKIKQKIVLGKIEGDKKDDNRKNWHGHVTVRERYIYIYILE
jgi:hypothetical protein